MPLTSDNSQLSRPTIAEFCAHTGAQRGALESPNYDAQVDAKAFDPSAQNERMLTYPLTARDYARESISLNTRRAYAADLNHFLEWGGSIPAKAHLVADYLAAMAETYKVATIRRHLASISKAHASTGTSNPCKDELVRATMRGIRRRLSVVQKQARPLLRDDLFALLDQMATQPKDIRDRALLLIGFATAMRRAELVALDFEDIQHVERGMLITLRSSKTDQEGHGRSIAVPFGRTRHCPIAALRNWFSFASIETGPVFLSVNRHGHVLPSRISAEAVTHILRTRADLAGFQSNYFSGHSLRAGFATSAANAGASTHKIRQTTGHRSDVSLARYIRDLDLFDNSAASKLI